MFSVGFSMLEIAVFDPCMGRGNSFDTPMERIEGGQ